MVWLRARRRVGRWGSPDLQGDFASVWSACNLTALSGQGAGGPVTVASAGWLEPPLPKRVLHKGSTLTAWCALTLCPGRGRLTLAACPAPPPSHSAAGSVARSACCNHNSQTRRRAVDRAQRALRLRHHIAPLGVITSGLAAGARVQGARLKIRGESIGLVNGRATAGLAAGGAVCILLGTTAVAQGRRVEKAHEEGREDKMPERMRGCRKNWGGCGGCRARVRRAGGLCRPTPGAPRAGCCVKRAFVWGREPGQRARARTEDELAKKGGGRAGTH